MNANTPLFRGALTVALLWIAAWGAFAGINYRNEMDELESSRYRTPDWLTENCYNYTFSLGDFHEQSHEGTSACLDNARKLHLRLIMGEDKIITERAFKSFSLKGFLPAVALLATIAFWRIIDGIFREVVAILRGAISSYLKWLRGGSTKPPKDSDAQ